MRALSVFFIVAFSTSLCRAQWEQMNLGAFDGDEVRCLASISSRSNGTTLIVGTWHGLYSMSTTDGGTSWDLSSRQFTEASVNCLSIADTVVIAGTSGGLLCSADRGTSRFVSGFPGSAVGAVDCSWPSVFAVVEGRIFHSIDGCSHWNPIASNISMNGGTAIVSSGTDLFAGVWGFGLRHSTDNGSSWSNAGFEGAGILSLISDVDTSGTTILYAAVELLAGRKVTPVGIGNISEQLTACESGVKTDGVSMSTTFVCYSSDLGATWSILDSTLLGLCLSTTGNGRMLIAGSDHGVYCYKDRNGQWSGACVGLQGSKIYALATSETDVFAGSKRSIWRLPLSVVSVSNQASMEPDHFGLSQNYPNPFNPTTAISHELSAVSYVSLKVYNVLGQDVATLVSAKQTPGTYTVQFDGLKLASGVYFYRLRAGNFTQIRRMLLMK